MKPKHLLWIGLALSTAQCGAVYSRDIAPTLSDYKGTPDRERPLNVYYPTKEDCEQSDEYAYWADLGENPYCYDFGWAEGGFGKWSVLMDPYKLIPPMPDAPDADGEESEETEFEDSERHPGVPDSEAVFDHNHSLRLTPRDFSPVAFAQAVSPISPLELSFFVVTEACSPLAASALSLAGMPGLFILEGV